MSSQGLLYVEGDCPPELDEEYHSWYNTEHIPERLGIKGFLQARRYAALIGTPRWLATYEVESPAVFDSPEYMSHYGDFQTSWTKRVTSKSLVNRSTYEVAWTSSPAIDPGTNRVATGLLTVRFGGSGEDLAKVEAWHDAEGAAQLLQLPGVLSAQRLRRTDPSPEEEGLALYELKNPWVTQNPEFVAAWTSGWEAKKKALSIFNRMLYVCIVDGK